MKLSFAKLIVGLVASITKSPFIDVKSQAQNLFYRKHLNTLNMIHDNLRRWRHYILSEEEYTGLMKSMVAVDWHDWSP